MRQTRGPIPGSTTELHHHLSARTRGVGLFVIALLLALVYAHAGRAQVDGTAPAFTSSTGSLTTRAATVDQPPCTGNCDGQDGVSPADLVTMLGVALGTNDLCTCAAGDRVAPTGVVTVDELVTAATFALTACPAMKLYCRTPAVAIPDANEFGVVDSLEIPDDVPITNLRVQIHVTHTWVGDLAVELYHLQGEEPPVALLLFPPGTCGGQNVDCTLDDTACVLADEQCTEATPAISGRLRPTEPLGIFAGQSSSGTWQLVVYDLLADDVGTFDSWCIEVE